jgi:hypothetical protein
MVSKKLEIIQYYFPPFFVEYGLYFRDIIKDFLNPDFKKLIKKNIELKNKGKGKRAFLIATGPSIKKQNLALLKGEDCFTVSNMFLHDDIKKINPKFHFFAPYHKPLILSNFVGWLRQADKKLPKNTKIFLGTESEKMVKKYKLFKNREIFYLKKGSNYSRKRVDLTKTIMPYSSVPLMVLPVLIYMGYKEIYLVGCDNNRLKDYSSGKAQHFFENSKDFRKNASSGKIWSGGIIKILISFRNNLCQYLFYANLAKKNYETKIFNLSDESWIECFNKKKFDKIKFKLR